MQINIEKKLLQCRKFERNTVFNYKQYYWTNMHTIMLGLYSRQSNAKTNVLKFKKKSKLAHSLPAYNAIMLYYITFYYTLSPIIIVSHLKVPSLQILHTEHYRVNLCWSETISFLVITFLALENKRSLATDVAGILPAAVWRLLLLTHTFGGSSPTRTVDVGCAKVSARRGKLSAVYAWSVATRRRQWQTTPI